METAFKYISFVDGPLAKYRFDIFLEGSPALAEHLLIFCSKFSYNLYEDYHDRLTFVILDELRDKYYTGVTREHLPSFTTEKEWLKSIHTFYGRSTGNYFPYDLHRFALPYLAEKGILNFCIVDNDVLFQPDSEIHVKAFSNIEPGTLYLHFFGISPSFENRINYLKKHLGPKFENFNFSNAKDFLDSDGYVRGFHFKTKEDLLLFFEIWNAGIALLLRPENRDKAGTGLGTIYQVEWFVSYLMQFFQTNKNYKCSNFHSLFYVNNRDVIVHKTRVEDTIYGGPRGQWERYNFDYSDTSTVSAFIKNNKSSLETYWKEHVPSVRITDTHVYTRLY